MTDRPTTSRIRALDNPALHQLPLCGGRGQRFFSSWRRTCGRDVMFDIAHLSSFLPSFLLNGRGRVQCSWITLHLIVARSCWRARAVLEGLLPFYRLLFYSTSQRSCVPLIFTDNRASKIFRLNWTLTNRSEDNHRMETWASQILYP